MFLSSRSVRTDCPFKLEKDDLDNKHRVLLDAIIRVILRRMENDDNDLNSSFPLLMLPSAKHLFSKDAAEQRGSRPSQAPPLSTAKTSSKPESFFNRSRRTSTTSEVSFQNQNPHHHAPVIISSQTTEPGLAPYYRGQQETTTRAYSQQIPICMDSTQYSHLRDVVEAAYQPPPPSRMQVSRPLPAPPQQQSANMNPSQPSPGMDKTYSNSSQPSPVTEKGYNSRLSDASLMPSRHPIHPPSYAYRPPLPLRTQVSRPLPAPPQQLVNTNPSQPCPVMDKTHSKPSQPSPVRETGYNSRLSDTSLMPSRHPIHPPSYAYRPPPPSRTPVSRPLPAPPQQQLVNTNPSQTSPVMDKAYSKSSQPSPVTEKGYNSRLSDTSLMPQHHPSYSPSYPRLPEYEVWQSFDDHIFELFSKSSSTSSSAALSRGPRQQPQTTSLPSYNSTHSDFQGPHKEEQHQHGYLPEPSLSNTYTTPLGVPQTLSPAEPSLSFPYSNTTYLPTPPIRLAIYPSIINASVVPSRSGMGIGIDDEEQRKSKMPKVYPVGRPVATPKRSEALKVCVSSGAQAASGSTSMMSMSPLSDLPLPVPLVPPMQVQASHMTPPVVPQYRLHHDDSMKLSSSLLPLSVPASTSSVPQKPPDKDRDSTSPTTSAPTPALFIYPPVRSRASPKAKLSTTNPFPTWFKGLRFFKGKTKKPERKKRERDKQVKDG